MIETRRVGSAAGSLAGAQSTFDARTPYEVFDREHRVLREGVAALRLALTGDPPSGRPGLLENLDTVRAQLAVHFAFEEDVGYMHYLRVARPALVATIDRLKTEHRDILSVLTKVSGDLRSGSGGADARTAVAATLEFLAHHELDEQKLLRSALLGV